MTLLRFNSRKLALTLLMDHKSACNDLGKVNFLLLAGCRSDWDRTRPKADASFLVARYENHCKCRTAAAVSTKLGKEL